MCSKRSPYREDDVPAPLNVYGSSKLAGETAVLKACPDAVVIRTSWVYSPFGNNFVRTMLRLAETQPMVRVVNNGRDTAGIYHLAGEGETSWHGTAIFASLARRGRRVPRLQAIRVEYATPARLSKNSCLDSSKADRIFGVWRPPWLFPLEERLERLEMPKELQA